MKEQIFELVFPQRCVICTQVLDWKNRREWLCRHCAENLPYFPREICPRCGGETDTAGFCRACLKEFAFPEAYAAFPYAEVRRAIKIFKYGGGKRLGYGLGDLMAEYLLRCHEELLQRTDLLLCVPLHPKKERKRRFNQAAILCERIAARTGLSFRREILERTKETVPQSTLSSERLRRENLRDAFAVREDLTGKRVLLVDDIFTTGATGNSCATELSRAGAERVMIYCLSAARLKME